MLERFGDNLTVTTSDISKLTHFPPEYYVSLLLYNPLVVYQKDNCSNLCYPTEGWMEVLAQKSKDGHVLNLLFSSEYIISYYCTLTFHITLFKLSCFFLNNVYTHHLETQSTITATILSNYLVVQMQLATRKKSVSGALSNNVSEPRLLSVAINWVLMLMR